MKIINHNLYPNKTAHSDGKEEFYTCFRKMAGNYARLFLFLIYFFPFLLKKTIIKKNQVIPAFYQGFMVIFIVGSENAGKCGFKLKIQQSARTKRQKEVQYLLPQKKLANSIEWIFFYDQLKLGIAENPGKRGEKLKIWESHENVFQRYCHQGSAKKKFSAFG